MAFKNFFVLSLILAIVYIATASTLQKRDVESDASKSIDDAIDSVKSTLDDLLKNVQSSDIYKDLGDAAKKFTEQIQEQGKDLIDKIKSSTN